MSAGRPQMCPNEACPSYRVATRLLGGCDCGAAFVPYVTEVEPTNEQLGRLVSLFSTKTPEVENITVEAATAVLDADPELRAAWLVRHGEFQLLLKGGSA